MAKITDDENIVIIDKNGKTHSSKEFIFTKTVKIKTIAGLAFNEDGIQNQMIDFVKEAME